jgi:rubredoxin
MTCNFCAYEFSEDEGAKTCGSCAWFGGCRMVKCPRCGYEMPQTPNLLKLLRKWGKRKSATSR